MNKATLALLSTAIIWATGFIAVDTAIHAGWQAFPLLACRGIIGGGALLLFSHKKKWWNNKTTLKLGIINGFVFFIAFAFQTVGQTMSSVPNTAFLSSLNVVFVPFISYFFLRRHIEKKVYLATALALIGSAVLSFSEGINFHLGDFYLFICAIFFALQIIYNEKCGAHNDPLSIATIQLFTMGVCGLILMLLSGQTTFPTQAYSSVLYLAVGSSALASVCQLYGQRLVEPSKASLILSLESILATILSIILLGQPISSAILIGGTLLFGAVLIVEVKFKKKDKQI